MNLVLFSYQRQRHHLENYRLMYLMNMDKSPQDSHSSIFNDYSLIPFNSYLLAQNCILILSTYYLETTHLCICLHFCLMKYIVFKRVHSFENNSITNAFIHSLHSALEVERPLYFKVLPLWCSW